jgi:hypothetical protein
MAKPMRRAIIIAMWIPIVIAASSAMSCTRVVDLDPPDAGVSNAPDAASTGSDGGADGGDGGPVPDAQFNFDGGIGDASFPDAF